MTKDQTKIFFEIYFYYFFPNHYYEGLYLTLYSNNDRNVCFSCLVSVKEQISDKIFKGFPVFYNIAAAAVVQTWKPRESLF